MIAFTAISKRLAERRRRICLIAQAGTASYDIAIAVAVVSGAAAHPRTGVRIAEALQDRREHLYIDRGGAEPD